MAQMQTRCGGPKGRRIQNHRRWLLIESVVAERAAIIFLVIVFETLGIIFALEDFIERVIAHFPLFTLCFIVLVLIINHHGSH